VPRPSKRLIVIVGSALMLGGAIAFLLVVLAPLFRSTDGFQTHAEETRVRFEHGAEHAATVVARALPDAMAEIERTHFGAFTKPVEIYVCASTASFERYGFHAAGAGGFVLNGRLFISPKSQNTPERLPRLLMHELSHLHFEQRLGFIAFARHVPGWFKEGIATHFSGGSGAENVSEAKAREAIACGNVFRLETRGSLRSPQTGARDGLNPHLFYRQSALFVAFLARKNPGAFERLVREIQARRSFSAAIERAYGHDARALWKEFTATVEP
jgi:hypothetical protein